MRQRCTYLYKMDRDVKKNKKHLVELTRGLMVQDIDTKNKET